jgi:hypothetical protein
MFRANPITIPVVRLHVQRRAKGYDFDDLSTAGDNP